MRIAEQQALCCLGGPLQEALLPLCTGGRRLGLQRRSFCHEEQPGSQASDFCQAKGLGESRFCDAIPEELYEVG